MKKNQNLIVKGIIVLAVLFIAVVFIKWLIVKVVFGLVKWLLIIGTTLLVLGGVKKLAFSGGPSDST